MLDPQFHKCAAHNLWSIRPLFRFSTYGSSESRRDRMLAHYNAMGSYNATSYKDRKARRGTLTVTDEEVRAAMLWGEFLCDPNIAYNR